MTRCINNFLSSEEQKEILDFIEYDKLRPYIYDESVGGTPPRRSTDSLSELYPRKHLQWKRALRTARNTGETYHTFILKNNVSCAIENFLEMLTLIIEHPYFEVPLKLFKFHDCEEILEILKGDLSICGFKPCPCPAGEKE